MNPEDKVLWNIKRINLEMENVMNCILEDIGLTASQGAVLLYILEHPGQYLCSTELHLRFGISKATVSSLLKKLRQKGYIQFIPCRSDDRQKLIQATAKAELLRELLHVRIQEMEQGVLSIFTEEDEHALVSSLQKLSRSLKTFRSGSVQQIKQKEMHVL